MLRSATSTCARATTSCSSFHRPVQQPATSLHAFPLRTALSQLTPLFRRWVDASGLTPTTTFSPEWEWRTGYETPQFFAQDMGVFTITGLPSFRWRRTNKELGHVRIS